MKSEYRELDEIKLVGITVKTSNKLETDPSTAKIGATLKYYGSVKLI